MSIIGGFYKAVEAGESINCTVIQIFTKSNRKWGSKEITDDEINIFKNALKISGIRSVVGHSTYMVNLGSPNQDVARKSKIALSLELKNCNKLGIIYLVLHPGAHLGSGEEVCLKQIAKYLDDIFDHNQGKTKIVLEIMAGQGTYVCYKFEHIAKILKMSRHKNRIGVCFDTCHAFAAGYDFRKPGTYKQTMQEFDKIIGLEKLLVFHINDSKREIGSRVDRHADIGTGQLGLESFKLIFNDARFLDVPKILETPDGTLENYKKNMEVIKKLITTKN